ncbi:MAG: shikimate kinase [Candidatus Cloacimonetes bacterium]|jgi:shikimate kinase|nr:shikimate kinase [Candidatus Cloacimonadota bacterium]MBT4333263.1 shikimate kinase [Candidatus Cloacimonadota bacterium]MBT4574973.1 shikimate kinase [Candidatus Cloacimonadota bacterium]MBT5419835.1 shikimate kinase [Candidatus Cloacimonadota bacterium]
MTEFKETFFKKDEQIFIIGFMGVGKTYIGEKLAKTLNLEFHDLDREIERKAELDVNDIFKLKGENTFRELESSILNSWNKPGIISTGGGIVELKENRDFIKTRKTIWLNPSWKIIRSRILNSYRPLVLDRGEDELYKLWDHRKEFYRECADIEFTKNSIEDLLLLLS